MKPISTNTNNSIYMLFSISKKKSAIKLNTTIRLYSLLAFMTAAILIIGINGISRLKTLNQITETVHYDRLVPIKQLSTVRFYYGTNLLSILSKVKKQKLTYEQAAIQLTQSEQKAKQNWQTYQNSFLTSKETQLVLKTSSTIKKANLTLVKLKTILKQGDTIALDHFIVKELYQTIVGVELKTDQLIALQIKVSEDKFKTSHEIYHKTLRDSYIFLVFLLSISLLLGLYMINNIRSLIKNLQISNNQITQNELQFKNLVEKSLVGVYIVQNEKFVYVNPKFASELGYTQEEMLNLNNVHEIVDNEYIPHELHEWRKKTATGIIDDFHIELKYIKKDGTSIWAEVYCGETVYKGTKATLCSFQNISERKIFEAQQLLISSIVNSSNDAIISKSLDGIITSWNKGAEKTLGYTEEEMIGEPISKIIPPHLIDKEKNILKSIQAGHSVNHYETQRIRKDGKLVEASLTISPIVDSMGKIIGASKILHNITERKKTEVIIKEQSDTFAAIIENANESIWLLSPDLKVLQFNKTGKERLLESRGKEIYPGANFKDFLYTGTEEIFMTMFNTALEGRYAELESCQANIYGDMFWLRTRMYPVYNIQNVLIGITVLSENITDRKNSEKKIEQSEERNRSLIENISDTIILVNEKLEVIYQSPSYVRTAGFSFEEHTGRTVLDIIYPDDLQHVRKIIEKTKVLPDKPIPFQLRIIHKKGHIVWIEGTITNLLDNESVKAYVLNYRDITTRKLMESERLKITSEILQRNRDLEQFAYIVSHNLRAPVANIIGITDYLKDKDIDQDEKDQMSDGLSVSAHALDEVIHDLNAILQTKREINEKNELVKFSEILNDVKSSIATLIDNKQVIFNTDFSEIDEITTLKSYIHSIFYNLISNSIKYKQPEIVPIIEISSRLTENNIELLFKDNGLGIDLEKNSEQVFGLYKRFNTDIEGKGMGLYMVKTQVETLGGKISVKSKINTGTEFKIKFKNQK